MRRRSTTPLAAAAAGGCTLALLLGTADPTLAGERRVPRDDAPRAAPTLDLGADGLREQRRTTALQPGLAYTKIVRGETDPSHVWTLEVRIPATATAPDPAAPPRVLSDQRSAELEADRLRARGFAPRVEQVQRPRAADVAPGVLGHRVRVGSFATQAEADAEGARLVAAGGSAATVFTGWDGADDDRGPWTVHVLTVDPERYRGQVAADYGPDLQRRETTSELAAARGAVAAVNAGYFAFAPQNGAPGDPAGAGAYDGVLVSEPVDGRPVLSVDRDGRARIERLSWSAVVELPGGTQVLDGTDRVPGLVRNCGGEASDRPTSAPLHDVTCTDADELVTLTPRFGASTPVGPGAEAVLDRHGRVLRVLGTRGTVLAPDQTGLQGTGAAAAAVAALQPGDRISTRTELTSDVGKARVADSVVNGGPLLVQDGQDRITQAADGFVRPADPSFSYGFVAKRNPRTFALTDTRGRLLLVTVDGRSTRDLGLSIPETADVARSLGAVDALNLDGGGSTAMVVGGQRVSRPSDATGERGVGDALLLLPTRRGG